MDQIRCDILKAHEIVMRIILSDPALRAEVLKNPLPLLRISMN